MGVLGEGAMSRRYNFTERALSMRGLNSSIYPWPLSARDEALGEKRERQQQDLALYWRRAYEVRQKRERGAA